MSRHKGNYFESLAEDFLLRQGFSVVEKNWHAGKLGEIDLICENSQEDLLVFVEVKGRNSGAYSLEDALNSITKVKARKLLLSIESYITKLKRSKVENLRFRFDVIAVIETKEKYKETHRIEHFENISLSDFLC